MTKTSVSKQFIKDYPEYKEYADFMDILDSSEKTFINQSKYVLKPFDEVLRLFNFIFFGVVLPGDIYTYHEFNWEENTAYFQQLFNAFLEWNEEDLFLRENGEGEYDYEEIAKWDILFDKLNKLPTEGTRFIFSIIEDVDRKQRDNHVKQIKNKIEENKTKTKKLDLLHKLRMSEQYKHYPTLIDWIDDTIYLIKNGRYEDATTDIKGYLDLTEIHILLELLSDEGLFPKIYSVSEITPASKSNLFLAKLFNRPLDSIEKSRKKAGEVTKKKLSPGQFYFRIKNLKNIKNMLDNISDANGIKDVIKKIDELINDFKVKEIKNQTNN